jgi:hypothetical protein
MDASQSHKSEPLLNSSTLPPGSRINLVGALLVAALVGTAHSFVAYSMMSTTHRLHAYVPDGLPSEEYRRIKDEEARRTRSKDLGRLGPRGFTSRSLRGWQVAFEKGQASHTFAPIKCKDQLQRGLIRKDDVPYMVRGGAWDNGDLGGGRRLKSSPHDREYARGGYKREQSASLLGSGPGLDWTGARRAQ